jgi:hypothetical protein
MALPYNGELIGYSGIAKINDNKYIVVHDSKQANEPRFSFININIDNKKIKITKEEALLDWKNDIAIDLESICKIPNKENEFLAFQSGYSYHKTGKIFHVKVKDNQINIINKYNLFPNEGINKEFDIEGSVCKASKENKDLILIIVSNRENKENLKSGLKFGVLDLSLEKKYINWEIYKNVFIKINIKKWKKGRNISDLYLDKKDTLWGVATKDLGDNGPFKSAIYKIGKLEFSSNKKTEKYYFSIKNISSKNYKSKVNDKINIKLKNNGYINGLKVEGISESPSFIKDSNMIFATDDENFGGILRMINIEN